VPLTRVLYPFSALFAHPPIQTVVDIIVICCSDPGYELVIFDRGDVAACFNKVRSNKVSAIFQSAYDDAKTDDTLNKIQEMLRGCCVILSIGHTT
jgi:hypothetical protein